MRKLGFAFLALATAFPAVAGASTQDFAFLVQQRVTAMECPGINVNVISVEDALFAEGKRLGWSKAETIREMEARRIHQVSKFKSNPSGFCSMAQETKATSSNRLRSLGVRP